MNTNFPKDFMWGASSSAFQIEGAFDKDGKGLNVADYNSFKKSHLQADTKVASDFYHNYEKDIELMKELGMKTYRFSISWARLIPDGDGEINQKGKIDFIAINYYRTNCASFLPTNEENQFGVREGTVDFDIYGLFKMSMNPSLKATEYGAAIDPSGLRLALNEYWERYHLSLIITENGLGTPDVLENGKIHDDYRIDYIREHLKACELAIKDGVNLMGYCPWSFIDLLSSAQGFRKRYGLVYVNRTDNNLLNLQIIKKDSFYWYKKVIESNGELER